MASLSYYGHSAGDMADLRAECNECDESCDVLPNNLGLRNRRDLTEKKTVFSLLDQGELQEFWETCGQYFFLDGKRPEGFKFSFLDFFICQRHKKDPYFATRFNTFRKTADFSAYKPNIGNLDRPGWKDLYEHGTYTGYLIYTYFSSHIHSDWAF